jgi:hypothetical protein
MPDEANASPPEDAALQNALREVLGPLARLAVSQGLRHGMVEEMLRQAFVDAATATIREHQPHILEHRMVSRISTVTGINRREVTRLTQEAAPAPRARPSVASEVFTRWVSERRYRHRNGVIRALPRQGDDPSFEALAHSVTRDVHPRSILQELCRLELARVDEATDTVHLTREAFVPQGDGARMLSFLGENVGDHLHAAVANVLSKEDTPHFEQALWANELSPEAAAQIKPMLRQQWQQLLKLITPELEQLIEQDKAEQRETTQRVRIGLYSYTGPSEAAPAPGADKTEP